MATVAEDRRTDIRKRFEAVETAIVCDVFDENGWDPPALDVAIGRKTGGAEKVAGWAYTFLGSHGFGQDADRLKLEAVDKLEEDSIAIWSGTDVRGVCLFGDLIAATMAQRGARGAIVDGGFRDVAEITRQGFPVFARYVTPVQAIGRWRLIDYQCPIAIQSAFGELTAITPGDFVLADDDGVVVIPQDRVDAVLERAEEIKRMEAEARSLGAEGLSAQDMLEKFGHV
jgi:4-hydroxy-4-methyl-2-oxoglutarate aldolase